MSKHRLPDERREQILAAALKLAAGGTVYTHLSRKQIMDEAGQSETLLNLYFGTMPAFRKELMRYAVAKENLAVLGQGLMMGDPIARHAPKALRQRVAAKIA